LRNKVGIVKKRRGKRIQNDSFSWVCEEILDVPLKRNN
jgi:hypothetical protein